MNSGVDWKALFQTVMDRYAERLETVRDLLEPALTPGESIEEELRAREAARKAQVVLRFILTPYITRDIVPPSPPSHPRSPDGKSNLSWASSVFKNCAPTFTGHLFSGDVDARLTKSESVMRDAIHQTNREICRAVVRMWALGVENGLDLSLPTSNKWSPSSVKRVIEQWKDDLDPLMKWLDWSIWVKCKPACGPEELCYLPTWPLVDPIPLPRRDGHGEKLQNNGEPEVDWLNPKPRCVRKVWPYEL